MNAHLRIAVTPRTPAPALFAAGVAAAAATVYLAVRSPQFVFVPAALAAAAYAGVRVGPLLLCLCGTVALLGVDMRVLEGSGFMSFSLAELALFGSLALYLLQSLRRRAPIDAPPHAAIMIALILYMILSNLFAEQVTHHLSETRNWLMAFLLLFLLRNALGRAEDRARMILVFVVACDLFAGMGLLQALFGLQTFTASPQMEFKRGFLDALGGGEAERVSAAVGLTAHSNGLGRLLSMALPLAAFMALGGAGTHRARTRAFFAVSIPLMGVCLFYTYSKGAIATCLVTLALLYATAWRGSRLTTMLAILGAVVGAAIASYLALDALGYTGLTETMGFRLELWRDVFVTLARHPLVAIFGNGQEVYGKLAQWEQPHNTYLFFLIQYGVVSAIMIFALLGLLISDVNRARTEAADPAERALAAAALAVALGFLTGELVESGFMSVTIKMLFFFLVYLGLPRTVRVGKGGADG